MTGFIIFDANGRILSLSERLKEFLGFDAPKWEGIFAEEPAAFTPPKGQILERTGYLSREKGEAVEAEIRSRLIDDEAGVCCVEIELTKLGVSVENGDVVSKASLEFLTTVSHELRVSLNSVIGFANLLGATELDGKQRELLDKLLSSNFMLKGLINDILEFSQIETSEIELKRENVHLNAFLNEIVDLYRERASAKSLGLRVETIPEKMGSARLPKLRVAQILSNLMSNAIKFTEEGWVSVTVSRGQDCLSFSIQDTGPGVSANEAESIFEPFSCAGPRNRSVEGSGLGLAISRSLVEKMGGKLSLENPISGGSVFKFTLPLEAEDNEVEQHRSPDSSQSDLNRTETPTADRESKHLLIVEDNKLNADILGHFLKEYGVTFDIVDNGRAAVKVYREDKYDLILMDVMLPEMNGYEATERILANSKKDPPVPIIGVTAKVFRQDQMRCIEVGMTEIVNKPVDFNLLRDVLDRHLYGDKALKRDPSASVAAREKEQRISGGAQSPLDKAALEVYIDRMSVDGGNRNDIVETAIAIIDDEIGKLLAAIDDGNRERISLLAHSLKGALNLLGASDTIDLAKGLEMVASRSDQPIRREHWHQLIDQSFEMFRAALQEYMASSTQRV